jgi:hypothetical protein
MSAITEENIKPNKQPICNNCKNHIKGLKCRAFEIIPDEIIFNEIKHIKPLKRQGNAVVFEPLDNA